jgi:alpha-galactosidase
MLFMVKKIVVFFLCLSLIHGSRAQSVTELYLDELPIPNFSYGIPSVSLKSRVGNDTFQMAGIRYNRGLGINTTGAILFQLNGKALEFSALVGPDDKANASMITSFYVIGDKKILFSSPEMKKGDLPKKVSVDLKGISRLALLVTNKDDVQRNFSNWADAKFLMIGSHKPIPISKNDEKYILTPKPSAKPRINSPAVFGARPGNPFLFSIVATGEKPIRFEAENLPVGLTLDSQTGIITGTVPQRGQYIVTMKATNQYGSARKTLRIKIGDTIALTPPIGWNGWNSWAREIDREKVLASAKAMVDMGLRDHGWTYINIDDAWQGPRGGPYNAIQPNEKFPAFSEMIHDIHAMGLKLGIYSTPWITSYAGFPGGSSNYADGRFTDTIRVNKRDYRYTGTHSFEKQDARQFAEWGVDYLKYDWRISLPEAKRMSDAIQKSGRDIVYSLSNSAPFSLVKEWASLANSWRTGPDIRDSWLSLYVSAFTLDKWASYTGPGHWNDPDMMILGNVTTGAKLHPTRLTADEQYSHVSLFALLSAPLLIGCPIEQLDAFTLNLLTNDEVIEIDQDPLGKSARLLSDDGAIQVWLKPLEDGSYAIGLFNVAGFGKTPQSYFPWGDEKPASYILDFNTIGLKGTWLVRDVWRQQDLGTYSKRFSTQIPHHGVKLIRLKQVSKR